MPFKNSYSLIFGGQTLVIDAVGQCATLTEDVVNVAYTLVCKVCEAWIDHVCTLLDLGLLFIYYSVSNLKKYFSLLIWCDRFREYS